MCAQVEVMYICMVDRQHTATRNIHLENTASTCTLALSGPRLYCEGQVVVIDCLMC